LVGAISTASGQSFTLKKGGSAGGASTITAINLSNSIFTGSPSDHGNTLIGEISNRPGVPATYAIGGPDAASFQVVTGSAWQPTNRVDPTLQTNGIVAGRPGGFSISITATPTGGGAPFTKSFALAPPPAPHNQGTIHTILPTGSDETSTIQNTINAAASGDTIRFGSGTHVINGSITAVGNLLYIGPTRTRAVLQGSGGTWSFTGSNAMIYGLVFKNLWMTIFGPLKNITVTNNIFDGQNSHLNDLLSHNGEINALISWNTFKNLPHQGAISSNGGCCSFGTSISRNATYDFLQPITYTNNSPGGKNNTYTFNYISNSSRFAIEIAASSGIPTSTGWQINDNYFVTETLGPSLVDAGTFEFARNFVWRNGGAGANFGTEFQAPGAARLHDNYIYGLPSISNNTGFYGSYTGRDTSVLANNNFWNITTDLKIEGSGHATISRSTHNELGIPPVFAAGAGP